MTDETIRESIEEPEQIIKALRAAYQVLGMIANPKGWTIVLRCTRRES